MGGSNQHWKGPVSWAIFCMEPNSPLPHPSLGEALETLFLENSPTPVKVNSSFTSFLFVALTIHITPEPDISTFLQLINNLFLISVSEKHHEPSIQRKIHWPFISHVSSLKTQVCLAIWAFIPDVPLIRF